MVVVHAEAGGRTGLGYTYSDATNAALVTDLLAPLAEGRDAFDIPAALLAMQRHVRNLGRDGLAATAISAVDVALWDLKAKLLDLPLAKLLGHGSRRRAGLRQRRLHQLRRRKLAGAARGMGRTGGLPLGEDEGRHATPPAIRRVLRQPAPPLAMRACSSMPTAPIPASRRLPLRSACARHGVVWFEEPVSSDDLAGLRLLRDRVPAPIEIAAGEYAYDLDSVRRTLEAGAVDVQQADASRCCGISGFLAAGALCDAHHIDLSGHCAPSLHVHAACAVPPLPPSGILPRPRADRTDAVRRRGAGAGRHDRARSVPPRAGTGLQTGRRCEVLGMSRALSPGQLGQLGRCGHFLAPRCDRAFAGRRCARPARDGSRRATAEPGGGDTGNLGAGR